jgi:hypothetical protein
MEKLVMGEHGVARVWMNNEPTSLQISHPNELRQWIRERVASETEVDAKYEELQSYGVTHL